MRDMDAADGGVFTVDRRASAAGQGRGRLPTAGLTALPGTEQWVVLNDSDATSTKRTLNVRSAWRGMPHGVCFHAVAKVVVVVPFDPHLRPGGVIDVNNEDRTLDARRFNEIAEAISRALRHHDRKAQGAR